MITTNKNTKKKIKKILYFLLTYFPNFNIIRSLVILKRPQFIIQFFLNQYFVKSLKVNLEEAEKPISEYKNVVSFFTRRLRSGARTIHPQPDTIISPVDAKILEYGNIDGSTLIQAKNKLYTLEQLVGFDLAPSFRNGKFITLYLSPRDYHRIHHPIDATLTETRYFPGTLYPVNPFSLNNFKLVFAKNKRIIVSYQNETIKLISCWIGALNVGRLNVLFDPYFYQSSTKKIDPSNQIYFKKNSQKQVKKGEEAGCFELGSTVILIMKPIEREASSPQKIEFTFKEKNFLYLGEELAKII